MPLGSGTRLGPYEVVEKLGEGGMGEVYLALDTRLNRKVALKYLSDPSLDLPRTRDRLIREARAAAQITHPSIAAIYDILDTATTPCIVMEYAHGDTLARMADRGPLPVRQVVSIGVQLADALARAHAAGVIHRDLKPANIILTPDGTPKILDFGVARVADIEPNAGSADVVTGEATQSQMGRLAGTPAYMAPEQLAGRRAGALSDVYSLGVTLYELLTGRRPFSGKTTAELVYEVMSSPTPLASDARDSVPPLLSEIVARAMARAVESRYQTAAEMADDLRRVARTCADEASTSPTDSTRIASRWPRVAIGAATVVALVVLVISAYALWRRSSQAPAVGTQFVAVLPFAVAGGDAVAASDAMAFSESLAGALEGLSSVAVLSRPEAAEYLGPSADVRKRVTELGVTMVVAGRASSKGATRQFEVEVQHPDGRPVAVRIYRADASALPELQRRAAADVVAALAVPLTPSDRDRLSRVPACLPDAYKDYAAGRALLAREDVQGNADKAEAAFGRAVARDPKCAPGYAGLADARWARFRDTRDPALIEPASQAIETACALDPVSTAINVSLATVYLGRGKTDQAERVIRAVIERRPYDDVPHRILSDILDRQGRSEEAMAELRRAVALRPNNVVNHVALGNTLYNKGRYADAVTVYQRVLQIQPDNAWALNNLGTAYWMTGDLDKALAAFLKVPNPDAMILSNTGAIYLSTGRYREALEVLRRAVGLAPHSDVKRRNLGDAYLHLGLKREAMEQYRQAAALTREQLAVNEKDGRVWARQALYEAKLGRAGDALTDAAKAVALDPDDNTVLYKRAAVHALLGQPKQAVDWLRKALDKGYSPADARADSDLDSIRGRSEVVEMLGAPR